LVRELEVIAGLSREEHADADADALSVNAAGYILAREAAEALRRWTPDTITTRPADRVLLVNRDDRRVDPTLAARLEALGSQVAQTRPGGTASMLDAPHLAKVPEEGLSEIVRWFSEWSMSSRRVVAQHAGVEQGDARLVRSEYAERTVRFGPR